MGDGLSHRLAVRRVAPPPGHPRIFGPNPTISSADAEPEYAIQGSQQDFDFLIVFDQTFVMIEAKATGSWDRRQYESKCKRLSALQDPVFATHNLNLSFILLSPGSPPRNWDGLLPGCVRQKHVELWFDDPTRHFISIGRGSLMGNCDTQEAVIALLAART
ncbi:MAG: hypothetical protein E5X76_13075 [Mesorhizobium sp.]|nr:MAG: hypothetical protein E5X76_13075 [Mesorhizobium sp.]